MLRTYTSRGEQEETKGGRKGGRSRGARARVVGMRAPRNHHRTRPTPSTPSTPPPPPPPRRPAPPDFGFQINGSFFFPRLDAHLPQRSRSEIRPLLRRRPPSCTFENFHLPLARLFASFVPPRTFVPSLPSPPADSPSRILNASIPPPSVSSPDELRVRDSANQFRELCSGIIRGKGGTWRRARWTDAGS